MCLKDVKRILCKVKKQKQTAVILEMFFFCNNNYNFQIYLGRMLLVRHHPPQRVNLDEGTCDPGEMQHPHRGRLMDSVEKERLEKSQPPAPKRWIYKRLLHIIVIIYGFEKHLTCHFCCSWHHLHNVVKVLVAAEKRTSHSSGPNWKN